MKPQLALPVTLAMALAVGAAPALAQPDASAARFDTTTLDLGGHGEVKVAPDMAAVTLGVTTEDPTAQTAMQANAAIMAKIVAALRAGGVEARDIQTSSLNLSPQYAYAQGAAPRLTGYQASNEATVTVEDLARLGPLVDAASAAGATNIGQISLGLKDHGAALGAARAAAVKDLDDKAAVFADAAGYRIRRLVNLREASSVAEPAPRMFVAAAMAAPAAVTPVEAGQLTVGVDVTGEFELSR